MVNVGKGDGTVEDRGWSLYIVSVVMVIVSGIFVLVRIAIRVSRRMMGMDDWMIIMALLSLIALSLTECLAVVHGYGKHSKDLTHQEAVTAFRWFYGAQITYKLAVAFYKESMLFLYLRIFPSRQFRIVCFILIGLVTASGVAFVLVTIWQCSPIDAFWDKTLLKTPGARCFSSEAFWFSYSVINIVLDFGILLLPIHEVLKLQLPWRDKIALVGIFSLGIFVCATAIIRTTTLAASATSTDPTWGIIPATVWSVVEANTGTICACLPMLKQPLAILFPRLFGTNKASSLAIPTPGEAGQRSYPLRSGPRRSRRSPNDTSGTGTVPDYHQWALADGTVMNAKDKDSYSSRESEDRERLTGTTTTSAQGGHPAILRTTDVSVTYDAEPDPFAVPKEPPLVYAG